MGTSGTCLPASDQKKESGDHHLPSASWPEWWYKGRFIIASVPFRVSVLIITTIGELVVHRDVI